MMGNHGFKGLTWYLLENDTSDTAKIDINNQNWGPHFIQIPAVNDEKYINVAVHNPSSWPLNSV